MRVYKNFNLTNYNSYRVKSKCSIAYFPENEQDVVSLYKDLENFILIGSGHNIIMSKEYYEEPFVIFNGNFNFSKVLKNNEIVAEAGAAMLDLSLLAANNGLSGLEIFYDIPSSLGGAVVMNAGASGEEIKDVITKVRYLDLEDYCVKEKAKEEIGFEFRNSFFQKNTNKIVLKVWMKLKKSDKNKVEEKMEAIKKARWAKQPKNYPNAGSVFKRPKGFYVGAIIEELKLKGYTVGGAKVSEKHGGFIINFDNAKGKDILDIIQYVKQKVFERFEVDLEVEQRVL